MPVSVVPETVDQARLEDLYWRLNELAAKERREWTFIQACDFIAEQLDMSRADVEQRLMDVPETREYHRASKQPE